MPSARSVSTHLTGQISASALFIWVCSLAFARVDAVPHHAAFVSMASSPSRLLPSSFVTSTLSSKRSIPSQKKHCSPNHYASSNIMRTFGIPPMQRFAAESPLSMTSSAGENTDAADENNSGMQEALSALGALSSLDLDDFDDVVDENLPDIKYSRTDDTPLSNYGKSTVEEAELYLEMWDALEGAEDETQSLEEGGNNYYEEEEESASDEEEILVELETDELPWTSINPILRLRGPVATGYGRGGKKLGVPTANLPASLFQSALEDVSPGVYFGWAVIEQPPSNTDDSSIKKGRNTPMKAVVNVGYSPTFEGSENKEKIVEAHLITDASPMDKSGVVVDNDKDNDDVIDDIDTVYSGEVEGDFYHETMRLQLIGFLRPEQKFDSFPDLIAQIHRDIGNADWALSSMPYMFSKEDEFISGCSDDSAGWIGSGGGGDDASWEFETW